MTHEQIEEMAKQADENPSAFGIENRDASFSPNGNVIRGRAELWNWHAYPPESYFLYIKEGKAITWMGDTLGRVLFGREWRDNFGGARVPITVHGTNGVKYHGTYFKSSGDYARVKASKR